MRSRGTCDVCREEPESDAHWVCGKCCNQRIRVAEAAVIAAAELVVEGWHYVNHGKQLEPSRIEREADLTTAVRALHEARKL